MTSLRTVTATLLTPRLVVVTARWRWPLSWLLGERCGFAERVLWFAGGYRWAWAATGALVPDDVERAIRAATWRAAA